MKKALLWLVVVVVCVFAGLWIGSAAMNRRAGDKPWPAGLGTLREVDARHPKQTASAAARRLTELARPVGIDFTGKKPDDAIRAEIAIYVQAQHQQATPAIGEPPTGVVAYFDQNTLQINALRDHLLSGSEVQWAVDREQGFEAPLPNLLAHLHTARLLTARALVQGRANRIAAWDDLHAAAAVGRSLESRSELISHLIALAVARMVNAAAWKLPLPVPAWWSATESVDQRRILLGAMQAETSMMWHRADASMKGVFYRLASPYTRYAMASYAIHQRETAELISTLTDCGLDAAAFDAKRRALIPRWNVMARVAAPNLASIWSRALRYEAEREATANALRVRAGQPIVERSQCSDGSWTYMHGTLSFGRGLPMPSPQTVMPLLLQIAEGQSVQ